METRKNNETKEFAIGTKIEYNGKLYEVVEEPFCDECYLKNICPNNDIDTNKNSDNLLNRDKRISIFGECSYIYRKDHKSVVFKEISKTKEKDVYNVGPLYKTNNELMPIQINVPNGYIIPYDFPLNTRRGFRTIYFLMKLSQHDMTTVIKDIIAVRHSGIDFIINICDKLEKENDYILTFLYGEARV